MSRSSLTLHVNQLELAMGLSEAEVKRAVTAAAEVEDIRSGEISLTFIDSTAMEALNQAHLGRAGPTDVIAFNLGEPDAPLGDIYICPDVAADSAREYDVELSEELLRLVIHGVLHVLGHDHPEGPGRESSRMYRLQESILSRLR